MEKEIDHLIELIGNKLKTLRNSLVTAESCTGGGIAYYFSKNPNSSSILERAFVSYSNQAKNELLSVKLHTLQIYGAVSKQVAIEMAEGALNASNARISIAVTGIAGPDTDFKNETGMVWIACAGIDKKTKSQFQKYVGNRKQFLLKVILYSLKFLNNYIQ